jgi:hypothetical protein
MIRPRERRNEENRLLVSENIQNVTEILPVIVQLHLAVRTLKVGGQLSAVR